MKLPESIIHLSIRLQPNSSVNKVVEIREDGSVKIRINAPAVEGKANKALCKYLHNILEIPVSNIEIIRGELSREKIIRINGIDADKVMSILQTHAKN
jgi:hypothetical protein